MKAGAAASVKPSTAAAALSRPRLEEPYVTSFNEMLAFVQRVHDLTGQPDLKDIIDRAHAVAGRVPRDG
jgi:hypothetical protein